MTTITPATFIGKQAEGYISFGSGQPDLPPPKEVYSIKPELIDFRYGTIQGQKPLREALAVQYPASHADNFVITNGASEALDMSLRVLKEMGGRKVLLPKPYYYSYLPLVKYAGMEPVFTELVEGKINFDDFQEKVHGCKAVLINSPSNPTGRVEDVSTLKKIEKLCTDLGVYMISDEVYKDLIYTRENYMLKGPRVITINSFSKTFAMCGFRVGYLWSPDKSFVDAVIEMKSHTSMNTNILGQEMALAATKVPKSFIDAQLKIWKERRDMIYKGLIELGLDLWKPEGAFYVLPKVKEPKKFVWEMYDKHKVITYLGEWFGADDRVRFSYALDIDKIEEGLKRIKTWLG